MKKILFILGFVLLTSCGPSQEEKQAAEMERQRVEKQASEKLAKEKANRTAAVTCAIMGESREMDGAVRVREINEARDKIGGEPFLMGDDVIKQAFEYGLCQTLILSGYLEYLQFLTEAMQERRIAAETLAEEERIAAEKRSEERRIVAEKRAEEQRIASEKRAEEQRIAAEKRAEEQRIAAEKQRIADSKLTVKEPFHPNGKLKSRTNFQSVADGGKEHGIEEKYYENGQLNYKRSYKDGKLHGLDERYYKNGQLNMKSTYKDGKQDGLYEEYHENGQLSFRSNWSDGESYGLAEAYYENGQLSGKRHHKGGKKHGFERHYDVEGSELFFSPKCYQDGVQVVISSCNKL